VTAPKAAQFSFHLIAQVEGHWPTGKVARIELIKSGLVNQTYRVSGADGRIYILRRYHPEVPEERIRLEHALLDQLEQVGFPLSPRLVAPLVPPTWKSLALPDGALRTMALMSFLPGEDRYTWDAPPKSTAATLALGAALARYHQAIWGWWPKAAAMADMNVADTEVEVLRRLGLTLCGDTLALARLGSLAPALANLHRSTWPLLMVHGDFHAANVRWAEADHICGIFDFEYTSPNWRLYDVGMAGACLATRWADRETGATADGRLNPALLEAFISGYDGAIRLQSPLPRLLPTEKAALPHYLALAHLLTLEWVLAPATRRRLGDIVAQAYTRHVRRALTWLAQSDGLL
jgi:Ser/Thr protein kinase RdoA (MazF antagonist)